MKYGLWPEINHTFLYVSCDSRTFSFKFFYFAHGLHGNFYPRTTRSTQILVKDFVQDSSLDVEP